jgi:protein TonB
MDSPRLGFRRATVTSWALVGIGIAGVAGASTLAYADTVKPPVADVPVDAAVPAPEVLVPAPAESLQSAPDVLTTTEVPPPPPTPETTAPPTPVPETTAEQAPVTQETPEPTYAPETTAEQAPAPVAQEAPTPKVTAPPTTTKRRQLTPTTVMAPNYSPHITVSRGS